MLMSLGAVVFDVTPLNLDRIASSGETAFAWHEVLGGAMVAEHVGEGESGWSFRGRVFPARFGGLGHLGQLEQARVAGEPQYAMRGDGRPIGWVVIERLEQEESHLDAGGTGQIVDFDITLRRAEPPSDGSFFATFAGLLGSDLAGLGR